MARTFIRFGIKPNEFREWKLAEILALYEEAAE